jgi:hypothetical protein
VGRKAMAIFMKKFISVLLSVLMITSVMACAVVSTNAATYNKGDIFIYKYVVKCDKIIEAFEGYVNFPTDDLTVEDDSDIDVFDNKTGSFESHFDVDVVRFNASSSKNVYDFTNGADMVSVVFTVKNPDFDPASIKTTIINFYDDDAFNTNSNVPFEYSNVVNDDVISTGIVDLDGTNTNATTESSEEVSATTESQEASSTIESSETSVTTVSETSTTTEPKETTSTDPSVTESISTDPTEVTTATESINTNPTESVTTEPVTVTEQTESSESTATTEPKETTSTEPSSTESVTTAPTTATEPKQTESVTTESSESTVATEPKETISTEPSSTESVTTAPTTVTEPKQTESVTTESSESTVATDPTNVEPIVCVHKNTTTKTTKATYFAKGKKVVTCNDCGEVVEKTSIAKKVLKTPSVTVKSAKKAIKVTYKKKVKNATGIQVYYKLKGAKKYVIKTFKTSKAVTKAIKGLKAGKKYSVKVRTYIKSGSNKAYSKWTTAKTIKIKK